MRPAEALSRAGRGATSRKRPAVLGIDAGSSSLRWRLLLATGTPADGANARLGQGRLGPLSGLAFLPGTPADRAEAEARVDALAVEVGDRLVEVGATLEAAYAGVTGLSTGDAAAGALAARLAERLALDPARVRVVDDTTLAYRSAFAPGEGIVVYAGTGSIAVHVAREGTLHRAGGHGYLVDDAGGGFWIGRQALRAVLREADRRGAPARGPLAEAIYHALGSREWPAIRERVYAGGREGVAALVPAVRHALRSRDPQAEAIVRRAGEELARLAEVLATRLGLETPVALAGGASGLGAPLRRALAANLPPGTEVRVSERTPVEAAAELARDLAR